ncbi:ABC transporter permease [Cohnella suwonensis]|uniref:Transport permease protein n=1 Tax=Cohnella suwonensis TaxID=696072 RepID=A0ABW0LS22_9BACL
MLKDIGWLMRKTLMNTFRSKKSLFLYLGLPIIGVFVSTFLYGNFNGGTLKVGVVDQDGGSALTQDAIRFVEGLKEVEMTVTDEATLKKDIAAGKLDSGLIFGEGFSASLRAGTEQPEQLTLLSVKGAQVTAYVKAMLQGYVANVASIGRETKGDAAGFDALYSAYRDQSFKVTTEQVTDTSHNKDMTYQSLGFLITFMLFSSVNLSELILGEKENRTFLRLLSSPISARTYVLANVAVSFVILFAQIVVTLFLMKNVMNIDSGVSSAHLFPILLLFALAAIALSLLIVSFSKSRAGAGALQNLIITPTCLLSGCFFPAEIMPDSVRQISNFLPQHWLLDSVEKLQRGDAFGSLGLNIAILFAFSAAFALVAIYRFGRNNDTKQFV